MLDHAVNALIGERGIGGDHHSKDKDRDSGGEQELSVAHVGHGPFDDVLGKGDRWGEQGAGGCAHDDREQGAKEYDLHPERHMGDHEAWQNEL